MFEREETRTTEPSAPLADFTFFIRTRFIEMTDAGAEQLSREQWRTPQDLLL
jgi:hypothetical protein